jgi:hypothetical protein
VIKEEAKYVIKEEEAKCATSASLLGLCYQRFSTTALLPALLYQLLPC